MMCSPFQSFRRRVARVLLVVGALVFVCSSGAESFSEFGSPAERAGWTTWSPREDIKPEFAVMHDAARSPGTSLSIHTRAGSEFGAWRREIANAKAGVTYRLSAWYRTSGVKHEAKSVAPRIEWRDKAGKQLRPPEYGLPVEEMDRWKRIEIVTPAPEKSASVEIQLGFGFATNATIDWDDITFEAVDAPRDRVIKVATVFHRPSKTKSAAESVEQFCQLALGTGSSKPDVICLPEGISVVGTGKSYWDVGESLPGPTSERLGAVARQLNSYIVAGIYEKEGSVLFNTAILVGRDGKLVGKYRKTHLPREEWEAGITPGDDYPVFETDFGKVGLLICWDVQFPEPSRAMARKGAELLLLPIWGGNETLAKARAIENHVFLVSSSYDMKTFIVDPEGKVLAEASKEKPVAMADLHLDKKIFQWWLGEMKARTWRERRPDIPID